jgi:hypothetical protein
VLALFAAVLLLFFVPGSTSRPSKSIRYRGPIYKAALMIFAANFIMLGYCGLKPAVAPFTTMSVIGTIIYFAFFLLCPGTRGSTARAGAVAGDVVKALRAFLVVLAADSREALRVRGGISAAGGERGRLEPRLAAAGRAQLRQLLHGLPLREVHALQPARHRPRAHRG